MGKIDCANRASDWRGVYYREKQAGSVELENSGSSPALKVRSFTHTLFMRGVIRARRACVNVKILNKSKDLTEKKKIREC